MSRALAALIALVASASLAAQTAVVVGLVGPSPLLVLWVLLLFFTIWANAAVAATFLAVALRGGPAPASWHGAVLAWIAVTGIVFHALLATGAGAEGSPFSTGLGWWSTQGLHTAVPLLVLLHWVGFAPKAGLGWRDALLWLLLPLAFCVFALARGVAEGRFVYPFLDPTALGWGGVALSVLGLLGVFLAVHGLIVGAARRLTRGPPPPAASALSGPPPR